MAHTIALCNNKGGVGKTTTTINLAHSLSLDGKSVLVIDADAEQGSLSCWLNARLDGGSPGPLFTLVSQFKPVLHTEIPKMLRASNYDYVLIDCPGKGTSAPMSRSALMCAELVIMPTKASGLDLWASDGFLKVYEEISSVTTIQIRILINQLNVNTRLGRDARASAATFEHPVFNTDIPNRTAIAESISVGKTIFEFPDHGIAQQAYTQLTEEVYLCLSSQDNVSTHSSSSTTERSELSIVKLNPRKSKRIAVSS